MKSNKEKYYNITKNVQPHLNVQKFLDYKLPPHKAIDIGCGAGRDTVALIKNNWEVLAIDKENTEHIIKESLNEQEQKRLKFMNCTFGDMELPRANLVVANFSLPFSRRVYFNLIWKKINNAIIDKRILCWKFFWKKRFLGKSKKRFSIFVRRRNKAII